MRWKKKYVAFALVFVLAILFYIKNKNASRKKICYHNLYDFTRTFASLSHSVIYYDPPESSISADLLTSRISAFSAPWSSDRECPPEKVSSFFTLAQANYTVAFRRLISLGFRLHKQTAAASTAFLDTSASSSAPVTSYFTLSRHRHHIELVLLYKVSSLGDVSSSHYAHYDTLSFGQSSYGRIPQLQKFVTDGITLRIPATYSSFNPFNSKHINCFNDRVLEYQNNYDLRVGEEGEKFRLNALSTLAIAAKALDQIGQEFWICSGTLLGWYRQCDVIAHSLDVDIGIRAADFNQEQLVDILAKFGLTLTQQLGTVGLGQRLCNRRYVIP